MKRLRNLMVMCMLAVTMSAAMPAISSADTRDEREYEAMWFSILHPGLGEWYLKGWGSFARCPQKKFWLGLIPIFGWPGYLQVKSAVDARHGRVNDDLGFE